MSNITKGNIILDSNLSYFSGLWFDMGLTILWMIPSIEKQKIIFRPIFVMIFFGAIGRIFLMISFGIPSIIFIIFTLMELLFPLLILWQNRIAKQ